MSPSRARPGAEPSGGGHAGDALSALLDGELDGDEAAAVRAHVERCRACSEELHWTRSARWALRSLPAVEPPPTLFADLAVPATSPAPLTSSRRRRRRPSPVAAAVSAAAAVGLVVVALGLVRPVPYEPRVDAAVGRHVASLQAMSAGGLVAVDGGSEPLEPAEPVTPTTAAPRDPSAVDPPFAAPVRLDGGYDLVDVFNHPEGLQLVYERGRYGLSVFEAPGRLDFSDLPGGGRRVDVAGAGGWQWQTPEVDGRVVVFERDGMVVTVVGDESGAAVLEAARSIPGPRPLSVLQRLRQAGAEILEAVSP